MRVCIKRDRVDGAKHVGNVFRPVVCGSNALVHSNSLALGFILSPPRMNELPKEIIPEHTNTQHQNPYIKCASQSEEHEICWYWRSVLRQPLFITDGYKHNFIFRLETNNKTAASVRVFVCVLWFRLSFTINGWYLQYTGIRRKFHQMTFQYILITNITLKCVCVSGTYRVDWEWKNIYIRWITTNQKRKKSVATTKIHDSIEMCDTIKLTLNW